MSMSTSNLKSGMSYAQFVGKAQAPSRTYPSSSVRAMYEKESANLQHKHSPSLMLPRVSLMFDPRVLEKTDLSKYGDIKLIDLSLQFDSATNAPYFSCFIHYKNWSTDCNAVRELADICNTNNRVVYPYGIGLVVENTSVDRYLSLSGYDSYHTADIDESFEKFWNDWEEPRIKFANMCDIMRNERAEEDKEILWQDMLEFESSSEYTMTDYEQDCTDDYIMKASIASLDFAGLSADSAEFDLRERIVD
jgi:hypothetical protein